MNPRGPEGDMAFRTFDEFWPFYLGEHRKPATRALHYLGTTCGYGLALLAVVTLNPLLVPGALVAGYGPAWVSHFFIEKNRPATFQHPLWSFFGDAKMLWCAVTGRLGAELERCEKEGFGRHLSVAA